MSYILLEPRSSQGEAAIKQQVDQSGYVALTREEFNERITDY